MSEACYCDYSSPTIYDVKMVVAKKAHKCSECGRHINKKEKYEYLKGLWDGEWGTFYTCQECLNLRKHLQELPCYCLYHGGLCEGVSDDLDSMMGDTTGFRFKTLRLIVAINRRKKLEKAKLQKNSVG